MSWWNTSWNKRTKITISNTTGASVSNFILNVKLNSSRIGYADFRTNGEDVRFVYSDDVTQLQHRIKIWNISGNSFLLARVSVLPVGNTDIYLYYGNGTCADGQTVETAFWSEWKDIRNMEEDTPSVGIDEESGNTNQHAVYIAGTDPAVNDSPMGKSWRWTGGSKGYAQTNPENQEAWPGYTHIFFIKTNLTTVSLNYIYSKIYGSFFRRFTITGTRYQYIYGGTAKIIETRVIPDADWHMITVVVVPITDMGNYWTSQNYIYFDETLDDSDTATGNWTAYQPSTFERFGNPTGGAVGSKWYEIDLSWYTDRAISLDEITEYKRNFNDAICSYAAAENRPDSFVLTVGGVEWQQYLMQNTFNVTDELNSRNTASFEIADTTLTFAPVVGQEVIAKIDYAVGTDDIIFSGTIDRVDKTNTPTDTAHFWKIECVDYNQIADRHLVATLYENTTSGAIVSDILATYINGEGITTGSISAGVTIERVVFPYMKASECLDELAQVNGFAWWIDYDKKLYFVDRDYVAAPFSLIAASANFRNMAVNDNRERYRNRQYIRAGMDITDVRSETVYGDGKKESFQLKFAVSSITSVTVEGVVKTFGVRGIDTGKDWYYIRGEKEISIDDDATAPAVDDVIDVVYYGMYPIIVLQEDAAQIAARIAVEGGTGVYDDIEDDEAIEKLDFAEQKAEALILKYGRIQRTIQFQTDNEIQSSVYDLRAGQKLTVNRPEYAINTTFLISRIMIRIENGVFRYDVEALDGDHLGGWSKFFEMLMRAGRRYGIRENEKIIIVRKFTEGITIAETFSKVEALASDDNDHTSNFRIGYATVGKSFVHDTFFAAVS